MRKMPNLAPPKNPYDRIAFYGPMGAGKSYCANYLAWERGYVPLSFAKKLKEIAADLFEVSGKDGADRLVLQQLGTKMREIDPDIWIKYVLSIAEKSGDPVVIDDLRYENEAEFLKQNGFKLIQVSTSTDIRRQRIARLYPNTPVDAFTHASEQEWLKIPSDAVVVSEDERVFDMINKLTAPVVV